VREEERLGDDGHDCCVPNDDHNNADDATANGYIASTRGDITADRSTPSRSSATATCLKYIDKKVGKGAMPQKGQTIVVNYTGMLVNGKTFDSNVDPMFGHLQPFKTKIGVGQVIPGWDEGMISMKIGGKRRLIIPPDLGYGARAMGDRIPANSTLIFDVELLGIEP
jgi:peptidylprolyl isomerase